MSAQLPDCGLYRTTAPVGDVPAGRLVYFHNHGDPGPGLYLPESWSYNRARFAARGTTLPEPHALQARQLEPLPAEGFYRVREPFDCCEKRCRRFEAELLVQVGYNGAGEAILFVPEFGPDGLILPTTGTPVARTSLAQLSPVNVAERPTAPAAASTARGMLH
jgi:hypothetical protein